MPRPTREGVSQTLSKLGIKSLGVTILGQCEMTVRSESRDKEDRTHAKELSAQVVKPQRLGVFVIQKVNTLSVISDRRANECEFAGNQPASGARIVNRGPLVGSFSGVRTA
jgi:hypothetical protein